MRTPDFPDSAYAKACDCIAAFEQLTSEYCQLLDTQTAMLCNNNDEGIAYHTARGDAITREIDGYGQQLRATRDALTDGEYDGPNSRDLAERFATLDRRVADIGTSTARLAAHCTARRDAAAAQLNAHVPPPPSAGLSVYRSFNRPTTLDVAV